MKQKRSPLTVIPYVILVTVISALLISLVRARESPNSQVITSSQQQRLRSSEKLDSRSHSISQGAANTKSASDLISALLDNDPEIREKAFNDLSQLGSGVAVPVLTEALQNQDWQIRVISAYSLGRLGTNAGAAVPALVASLKDANADVRFSAAQALGKINSEQAVSPLINVLQDQDENVRFASASALLQLGSKVQYDNLRILVRFLNTGNPMPVYSKFTIVDTLTLGSRLAIPAYVEALGSSDWFLRNQAADALAKLKVNSIPILTNSLSIAGEDSSGYVRGIFTNTFLGTNSDRLIEILKTSKDTNIRQQAAQVLGMLGDKKVVPSLINALQNEKEPQTAIKIIQALGRIGSEDAIPVILRTWQKFSSFNPSEVFGLKEQVILGVEQIGSPDTLSTLIAAFPKEEKSFVSSATVRKIVKGEINSQESISSLTNILQGGDIDSIVRIIDPSELANNSPVYVSALKISLQKLGTKKVVSILKPILLKEDEEGARVVSNRNAVVKYLSLFGDNAVLAILNSFSEVEAFSVFASIDSSEDIPTQTLTKNILKQVSPKIIPSLLNILRDTKSDERSNAAEALGGVRSEEAVPFLIKALTSKDDNLKLAAIIALGNIGSAEAVPALTNTLKNKEDYIRWWSAIALGKIKSAKATPYLIEALQRDSDESVRLYVADALGKIGSSKGVPILIASLKDKSYSVREAAAETLGQIKSKAAIPALIKALKDENWAVRLNAATALKSIGVDAVSPLVKVLNSNLDNPSALQAALKDKNADHRRSAAYILWQMSSLANQAKNDLIAVVKNENDNLYVRWMAATALKNMEQDMDRFFVDNNLIRSQNLTPTQCPNDHYNAEFDLELDTGGFYEEVTVNTYELIYAGRCIYGDIPQGGGTPYGFYERLTALLSQRR